MELPNNDRVNQAFEMIEQGVKDVFSSDNFKNYLSFLSKFHTYSLNNMILIMSQYPEATLVAGYNSWLKNFNRHVNKGEKAIKILAPYEVKNTYLVDKRDENGNVILDENGNHAKEEQERKTVSFMVVNVFDVAQTSGDPLPELGNKELSGTSKEIRLLIESIQEVCTIPVEFKEAAGDSVLMNGAKGYYDKIADKIVVNSSMEDKQILKTLVHEYAHSLLHKNTEKNPSQKEIEAESLAYVICDHFGIDTGDYSFTYVAAYASDEYKQLKQILLDIHTSAHEIIERIEPVYEQKLLENFEIEIYPSSDLMKENYQRLLKTAKPMMEGDANYIRMTSEGFMDLNIEKLGEDLITISHYFEKDGNLVADPCIQTIFDTESQFALCQSYQVDSLNYCQRANDTPEAADELNGLLNDWLHNIQNSRYRISEIHTEEKNYSTEKNLSEMKQYCRQYAMTSMIEKRKEAPER